MGTVPEILKDFMPPGKYNHSYRQDDHPNPHFIIFCWFSLSLCLASSLFFFYLFFFHRSIDHRQLNRSSQSGVLYFLSFFCFLVSSSSMGAGLVKGISSAYSGGMKSFKISGTVMPVSV